MHSRPNRSVLPKVGFKNPKTLWGRRSMVRSVWRHSHPCFLGAQFSNPVAWHTIMFLNLMLQNLLGYRTFKNIKWTFFFFLIFPFIFISWKLITLQYCSGFCHTLTWISHGFICIPHSNPPSHLPLHPIPLGLPSAPAPSTCLMHPTWAGDLFYPW